VNKNTVETWTWVLIYGGLLLVCLGIFVVKTNASLGYGVMSGGAVGVLLGVVLVYVRSRMKGD
jgi:heme A synthase